MYSWHGPLGFNTKESLMERLTGFMARPMEEVFKVAPNLIYPSVLISVNDNPALPMDFSLSRSPYLTHQCMILVQSSKYVQNRLTLIIFIPVILAHANITFEVSHCNNKYCI